MVYKIKQACKILAPILGMPVVFVECSMPLEEIALYADAYRPPKKNDELTTDELWDKYKVPEKNRLGHRKPVEKTN